MAGEAAARVHGVGLDALDRGVEAHRAGALAACLATHGVEQGDGDVASACRGVDGEQMEPPHLAGGEVLPAGAARAGPVSGGGAVPHVRVEVHGHGAEKDGILAGRAVVDGGGVEGAPVGAGREQATRHAGRRPDTRDPAAGAACRAHVGVERVEPLGPEARDGQAHDGDVGRDVRAALVAHVVAGDGDEELARHGGGSHLGEIVVDAGLHDLGRAGDGGDDAVGLLGEDLVELADHDGHGTGDARQRGGVDLRLLDHELQELGDAGGLGGGGHRRAVLQRDALLALLGPAAVLGRGIGHPVGVLLGQPGGREVGAERGHGEDVLAPVAGEEQAQDAAVGEAEHVDLRHAEA